ncbi:VCBS repeat-containing protein [Cytophagaceae bacterium AH-315-L13]|nr:VCBS repeat-containing protein [Cytophagaceae bacterium AH-315-L13]
MRVILKYFITKIASLAVVVIVFFPIAISAQIFTKITIGEIVTDLGNSRAAAWIDYNNDNNIDLYVTDKGDVNLLYTNNGDSTFTKNTTSYVVLESSNALGCTWGDYDNNGFIDAYVANGGFVNNYLYMNEGNSYFEKILSGDVVSDGSVSLSSAWGDYDNDGFLDLYVATGFGNFVNYLYHNNGDGTFTQITTGDIANDITYSMTCTWADYDNDGFLDLFVVNGPASGENNTLYNNNGDGTFTKVINEIVVMDSARSVGASWGDYDNDNDLDLYVTNYDQENFLYINNGNGSFSKNVLAGDIVTDNDTSIGSAWGDYDNDGDLDMFVAQGGAGGAMDNALFTNNGDGTFTKVINNVVVMDSGSSVSASWADYNKDGFLDLYVTNLNFEANSLYSNNTNLNSWINILCQGDSSNTSAIGAKVRIKANINGKNVWQLREISSQSGHRAQSSLNVHFGLGNATTIDTIIVEWPSGIIWDTSNVPINQFLSFNEKENKNECVTSCVWPGDANNNGVANVWDLLAIGVAYQDTGPARGNATIEWVGQTSKSWNDSIYSDLDKMFIDCDGNGIIEIEDASAIELNYGKTHSKTNNSDSYDAANPDLYFDVLTTDIAPGTTVEIDIMIGRDTNTNVKVYGYAFCINYDYSLIDSGSILIDFSNSWINRDTNSFSIAQNFHNSGILDVGFVNSDHKNAIGNGAIAKLQFKIVNDITGKKEITKELQLSFCDVEAIDSIGQQVTLNAFKDTLIITDTTTGIGNLFSFETQVNIYPNPATNEINILLGSEDNVINEIRIFNILGQEFILPQIIKINRLTLDVSDLADGLYILKIGTNNQIISEKINVIKQ